MYFSQAKKGSLLLIFLSALLISINTQAIELYKGVILDVETQQVIIASNESRIDSLDIESGQVNWSSKSAQLPLAVADSELYSQSSAESANELVIVKTNTNGEFVEKQSFTMAAKVRPVLQETLETKFTLNSIPNTNKKSNEITFQWAYKNQIAQGMKSETAPKPITSFGNMKLSDNSLKSAQIKAINSDQIKRPTHHQADFLKGVEGRQFKSISGNYILASRSLNNSNFNKYEWDIYEISGKLLGTIKTHTSFRPFEVVAGQLLFVDTSVVQWVKKKYKTEPLSVKSFSLKDSKLSWKKEVRDFSYTGPLPH